MNTTKQVSCLLCKNEANNTFYTRSKDYEYYTEQEEYSFYTCGNCSLLFIDPVPENKLNIIYPPNYYSFVDKPKGGVQKVKEFLDKRIFKSLLSEIKSQEISALDIGGGNGWLLQLAKDADARVKYTQVVDLDSNAKKIAEENGHRYFEGRIEDFKTDKKFNFIILLNLIEHVAAPQEILQKVEHLLADDGLILIKTPNTDSLDAVLFKNSYWGGLHCPRHWVLFNAKSFDFLLGMTGLHIHQKKYTQGAPFWAYSMMHFLNKKGLIKLSKEDPMIYHPLFGPLSALFAGFDFIRGLFFKTSQMFIVLKK
jgi:2-polyprenyl-3-methyl-5-hydroxy-6-metoxy-1,4-benzoquinol methylase